MLQQRRRRTGQTGEENKAVTVELQCSTDQMSRILICGACPILMYL